MGVVCDHYRSLPLSGGGGGVMFVVCGGGGGPRCVYMCAYHGRVLGATG